MMLFRRQVNSSAVVVPASVPPSTRRRKGAGKPLQALLLAATTLALLTVTLLTRAFLDDRAARPDSPSPGAAPRPLAAGSRASTTDRIASLQAQVRAHPNDVSSLTSLAQTHLQQIRETGDPGDYARADASIQKAIKLDPQNVAALSVKADLAFARHQFKASLSLAEQARALNPSRASIYGIIGDDLIELGRYDEAVQTYQAMINLRPDLASYSRVSYARELYGDIPGAIDAMQQAIAAGSPNAENTAWAEAYLGNLFLNYTGDLEGATRSYRRALATFPTYVHALAGLAAVSAVKGNYDQAIAQYSQIVQIIPLPQYLIALGDIFQLTGNRADAQRTYALVQAEEKLYQANGVDMDLDIALFDADHGVNLSQGLERARRAMKERPSVTTADVLAWTLFKTGHLQEASDTEQRALRLSRTNALALFHAGMIASALGQRDNAIDNLQQALSTNAAASNQPYLQVLYGQMARAELAKLKGAN